MSNGILASEISVQLTRFPTDIKLYQHVRNVSLSIGRACVEMAKDIALFRSVGVKPPNAEIYTALMHHAEFVFVKVSKNLPNGDLIRPAFHHCALSCTGLHMSLVKVR